MKTGKNRSADSIANEHFDVPNTSNPNRLNYENIGVDKTEWRRWKGKKMSETSDRHFLRKKRTTKQKKEKEKRAFYAVDPNFRSIQSGKRNLFLLFLLFYLLCNGFSSSTAFQESSVEFYRVLLGFTEFHRRSGASRKSCRRFHGTQLRFTGFYWVFSGCFVNLLAVT